MAEVDPTYSKDLGGRLAIPVVVCGYYESGSTFEECAYTVTTASMVA